MFNRRQLLGAGVVGAALVAEQSRSETSNIGLPEAAFNEDAKTLVSKATSIGPDYNPVVTINGWTLPFRMNNNIKEFHLVAEPVNRELADGMVANLWDYNGQSTGLLSKQWREIGHKFL